MATTDDATQLMRQQAAERERQEQAKAVEYRSTQQWLQGELDERARPVEIMGREFEFRPIGNEKVQDALEVAASEVSNLDGDVESLEDVDGDDLEDLPQLIQAIREVLEDHCTDEYMAREGLKKIPADTLFETFEEIGASGN